jgi:hypothetical protein
MGDQSVCRLLLVVSQLCGKAGGNRGALYPPVLELGPHPMLGGDGEAFLLESPR